jgi:hypothetical protein
MIAPAAARRQSTASPDYTNVVGRLFRWSNSALSLNAANEASIAKPSRSGPYNPSAIPGSWLPTNAAGCRSRRSDCQRACLFLNSSTAS